MRNVIILFLVVNASCMGQSTDCELRSFDSMANEQSEEYFMEKEASGNDFTLDRLDTSVKYTKKEVTDGWLLTAYIYLYTRCDFDYQGKIILEGNKLFLGFEVAKKGASTYEMCHRKLTYSIFTKQTDIELNFDLARF